MHKLKACDSEINYLNDLIRSEKLGHVHVFRLLLEFSPAGVYYIKPKLPMFSLTGSL